MWQIIETSLSFLSPPSSRPPLPPRSGCPTCVLYSPSACFYPGGSGTLRAQVGGILRVWYCGGAKGDQARPWAASGPEFMGDAGGKSVFLPKVWLDTRS